MITRKLEITIPKKAILAAMDTQIAGAYIAIVVKVDWPELQLSEQQIMENSVAMVNGELMPHQDLSLINIVLPRVFKMEQEDGSKD